jgi:hypothetical protein
MKIRAKNTIDMLIHIEFLWPYGYTLVLSNHKSFYGCIHIVLNKKRLIRNSFKILIANSYVYPQQLCEMTTEKSNIINPIPYPINWVCIEKKLKAYFNNMQEKNSLAWLSCCVLRIYAILTLHWHRSLTTLHTKTILNIFFFGVVVFFLFLKRVPAKKQSFWSYF